METKVGMKFTHKQNLYWGKDRVDYYVFLAVVTEITPRFVKYKNIKVLDECIKMPFSRAGNMSKGGSCVDITALPEFTLWEKLYVIVCAINNVKGWVDYHGDLTTDPAEAEHFTLDDLIRFEIAGKFHHVHAEEVENESL